ncbi:hypothetical protein AKJ64_01800 [candidate division MSBL1 archaeon SCGC-AAA259E17]|uniref:PKD/Chitinase domain-containing protein n=1 Tax=candidate division MSBL1 archaeon SCGC-AAA259E17 TaxID=1698263 RepID=A0A133UFI0_9EURY|nr:hypothetical protein AKJ64_01800 [candidate division MSBL1 archaeon SCGC-AAA259E17]
MERDGNASTVVSPFLTLEAIEAGVDYLAGIGSEWELEVDGAKVPLDNWSLRVEGDVWNTEVVKYVDTPYGRLSVIYQFSFKEKPRLYTKFEASEDNHYVNLSWRMDATDVELGRRLVGYDSENKPIYVFENGGWAILDNRLLVSWEDDQVENVGTGSFELRFKGFSPEPGVEHVFDPNTSFSPLKGYALREWHKMLGYPEIVDSGVHANSRCVAKGMATDGEMQDQPGYGVYHYAGWFAFDTGDDGLIPSGRINSIDLSFEYEKARQFSSGFSSNVNSVTRTSRVKYYGTLSPSEFSQRGFPTSGSNIYDGHEKVNAIFSGLSSGDEVEPLPGGTSGEKNVSVSTYESSFDRANRMVVFGVILDDYSDIELREGRDYSDQYLGARLSDIKLVINYEGPNHPPTADAGGPYSVEEGGTVELDGTDSGDKDGSIERYSWTVTDDPTGGASLSNSDTSTPSLSAPLVISSTEVTVELTVEDDDGANDSDEATVTVEPKPNDPPTADAGGSYSVDEEETVELDGRGSSDPDGDTLDYSWEIADDPTGGATLTYSRTKTPTFNAPDEISSAGDVTVELTDEDGDGLPELAVKFDCFEVEETLEVGDERACRKSL